MRALVILLLLIPGPWLVAEESSGRQVDFGLKVAQKGLWQEARFRFERAVQLDPGNAAALNDLAYPAETAAAAAPVDAVGQDRLPRSTAVRPAAMTDRIHALREHLKGELRAFVARFEIELLVIENASSIPLNLPLLKGASLVGV